MILLGIAAESSADAGLVTGLADRVTLAHVDWITADVIDAHRTWRGVLGAAYLDVHAAYRMARSRRLPIYGHFDGEPGAEDAQTIRAILLLFAEEDAPPAVVVIARDLDNNPERELGFLQARTAGSWPFTVVGALADPEIEAWQVLACTPESDEEYAAHHAVRKRIGFDPTRYPEKLSSRKAMDKRDAKRVLEELCSGGRAAVERWHTTPLDELLNRGVGCGLADFVKGAEKAIVPVLSGIKARPTP